MAGIRVWKVGDIIEERPGNGARIARNLSPFIPLLDKLAANLISEGLATAGDIKNDRRNFAWLAASSFENRLKSRYKAEAERMTFEPSRAAFLQGMGDALYRLCELFNETEREARAAGAVLSDLDFIKLKEGKGSEIHFAVDEAGADASEAVRINTQAQADAINLAADIVGDIARLEDICRKKFGGEVTGYKFANQHDRRALITFSEFGIYLNPEAVAHLGETPK